jgi:hypothetical protein
MRTGDVTTATTGENQVPQAHNFIYAHRSGGPPIAPANWKLGSWMSAVQVYTEGNYGQPEVSQYLNTGFWFFDYQLALKQYASILSIFTLEKVNDVFGDRVIHEYFYVAEAQMHKWRYTREDEDDMAVAGPWDLWTGTGAEANSAFQTLEKLMYLRCPLVQDGSTVSGYDINPAFYNEYVDDLLPPATENCWLAIRGIQGLDIDDNHKLMCFQYQDI